MELNSNIFIQLSSVYFFHYVTNMYHNFPVDLLFYLCFMQTDRARNIILGPTLTYINVSLSDEIM